MRLKNIFMFSGQGSQYYQMGRGLYERDAVFRNTLDSLDAIVREEMGESILERVYGKTYRPEMVFDEFRFTHPAIFMLEYALARMLMAQGISPDMVLGMSLGEVAAAAIAGAVEPKDCLSMLIRQAEIFEARCPRGGMLAVLAPPELFHQNELFFQHSSLAAINSASNFVVAGGEPELRSIEEYLSDRRILFQRLPVAFGFHSPQIEPVRDEFQAVLERFPFGSPKIPFISCTAMGRVTEFDADYFWKVLRNPFHFGSIIEDLEKQGQFVYLDLGPSGTLWNQVKSVLKEGSLSQTFPLLSPYAKDTTLLEKVLTYFAHEKETREKVEASHMKSKKLRIYVFPGQGSQFKGMGRELFEQFGELTAKADAVLGYSIRKLCVEDPEGQLGRTEYTQPALYVVNALTYLKTLQEGAPLPDYVLGHSLGEYDALFASGAFDFETGLRLVKKRGELMSRAKGGSMAAVVGCEVAAISEILQSQGLDSIDVANFNSPSQTVIAGPRDALEKAGPLFEEVKARYVPLNVSAPFHSRYMEASAAEFGQFLDEFDFYTLKIPVIANVDARPYRDDEIKTKLRQQIAQPVQWTESIRYLMGKGTLEVKELGPGKVLTGLLAKIEREATPLLSPDSVATDNGRAASGNGHARRLELAEPKPPQATAETLGSPEFRADYGVRYAYVAGGMHYGVSSKELVARMARAGFMAYYGTPGVSLAEVEQNISALRSELQQGESFGMNLTADPLSPRLEKELVDLFLRHDINFIEVSSYSQITPALVKYRLKGATAEGAGRARAPRKILAKVTRPEIARLFLSPAPQRTVNRLLEEREITPEEAELSSRLAMADDICAQADAGGHTDMGVMSALLPSIIRLRDEVEQQYRFSRQSRIGAAGGIGTAEAAAAAFILGAEFILTGSVNQCTVEAGVSARVKDMLQQLDVQDTTYAPSGQMFELGARVRVMKKGVFFHARANKLYDLWRQSNSWDEIEPDTRRQIEDKYFQASFAEIYENLRRNLTAEDAERAERDPKHKMALVFRWYCNRGILLTLNGDERREVDFQVYCGPALGALNQWLKGTELEDWRSRHVDQLGRKMMDEAAALLNETLGRLTRRDVNV
ncbi:MAG TPA: ACP S-malonyltransferase [Pyrinomonadaceae bacterium]|jgi:trans-AT polyketide synthase/acyltransferase/oxidoreductase domain-containing protein